VQSEGISRLVEEEEAGILLSQGWLAGRPFQRRNPVVEVWSENSLLQSLTLADLEEVSS
jgi:hypothetical protein